MENVKKIRHWNNPISRRSDKLRLVLIVGTALAVILGGLAGLNPFVGLAIGSVMFLLVLVLPRPIFIVYGLTLLLPLTGGIARGAVIPFLRLGQGLLVVGFILFLLTKPGRLDRSRLTAIDLAFVIFFLSETAFPVLALLYRGENLNLNDTNNIYGVSPIQTLLGPIQYYLLYRIVVATISSKRQVEGVLKLSFIASIIVSIIGILQKLNVAPVKEFLNTYYLSFTLHPVADINQRITSTLENYSGLGAYLTFTIIVALTCYIARHPLRISSLLLAMTLLLDSIALVLTGTLAAWIGLAIGASVVFLLTRRLPKAVVLVMAAIGIAVLIFQPFISSRIYEQFGPGAAQGVLPQSLAFRIMLWQDIFLPAIQQHLFFGSGPAPAANALWSTEESQYLLLLLRGGLCYFLSYLLLIGVAMVACWRQIKRKSEEAVRPVAIATLAILIALSVMSVSAEYFTFTGAAQTLWMLLAVVVAGGQFQRLKSPVGAKPDGDNEWQVIGRPAKLGMNASVHPITLQAESISARKKCTRNSHGLAPDASGCEKNRSGRYRRSLAWLQRLLDWHFVKDSTVVGVGSTVARLLGLLCTSLLTHFLMPDDFGFYQYSITLAGIVGIAAIASPVGVARFLAANAKDPLARDRYFSNGLLGVALLLVISLIISVPILWLMRSLNLATIICTFCLAAFYGYLALLRGMSNAWKIGLTYLLGNVALVIALFVVFGLFKLHDATVAIAIFGLTDLVPILVLEQIRPIGLHFRPDLISKDVLLELTWFAVPIVLATGAYTIWSGLDMLLVENFSPHAAGSYAVAKTLSGAFLFVPSAISMVLMPKVAALEPNKSKRYSQGAVGIILLISLIGMAIVGIWGNTLITLAFGQRYSDAYVPLLLLSAGMSLYAIYTILEGFIIGRGLPRLTIQALSVALISTTAAGFYLTPRQGPLGASLSFTIGAALGTMVMLFNIWRFHRSESRNTASGPPAHEH